VDGGVEVRGWGGGGGKGGGVDGCACKGARGCVHVCFGLFVLVCRRSVDDVGCVSVEL
jgi:hypothetical protein